MTEIVRIISGGAAQGLVRALEPQSGVRVEGSFGAVGAMRDKLLAGEPCDVVILSDALIRELAAGGHVDARTVRAIGPVNTGVAMRAGEAAQHIGSAEDLKRLLDSASEIYFPDPVKATAGIHFMKVLRALGLAESHAGRFRTFPNGATAMGEMAASGKPGAVGCTQVTEILITEGAQLIGLLPPPHELATVYTAAVATNAWNREKALALIELLCGDAAAGARKTAGFS